MYAYRLTNAGSGSVRYGNCEVCGKPADTIYHLVRLHRYFSIIKKTESLAFDYDSFGHKKCLSELTETQS